MVTSHKWTQTEIYHKISRTVVEIEPSIYQWKKKGGLQLARCRYKAFDKELGQYFGQAILGKGTQNSKPKLRPPNRERKQDSGER